MLPRGEGAEGSEKALWPGDKWPEASEVAEGDLPVMGTIRPLRLFSDDLGFFDSTVRTGSRSGGRGSSGAESGRPLTTHTSCASVQVSSWSFRPFQNGAKRRSI